MKGWKVAALLYIRLPNRCNLAPQLRKTTYGTSLLFPFHHFISQHLVPRMTTDNGDEPAVDAGVHAWDVEMMRGRYRGDENACKKRKGGT
jgi:hypothetical protein